MRTRTITLLALMTCTAVGVGVLIAPSNKEVALMHMRDANFDEALKLYTNLQTQGDDSAGVIMPLVNLNVHFGDTEKAIDLLQDFIGEHPRSIEARKALANLFKASERLNDYCVELEQLEKVSPSVDTLKKLATTYDFLGNYPKERAALQKLIEGKGYKPREDDYTKLAELERVMNDPTDAAEVIPEGLEALEYKVSADTMRLGIQLLLSTDHSSRAATIARTYLRKTGSAEDAILFSALFQAHGEFNVAADMLKPYFGDIDNSPDLETQLVGVLLGQGKDDEVFSLLTRQFKQNILPPVLATTLIEQSIRRKDYPLVLAVINSTALEKIPENALVEYVDFAGRTDHLDIAKAIKTRVTPEFLQQNPLLAAVIAVTLDDTPVSVDHLAALPDEAMVYSDEKLVVAGILIIHGKIDRASVLFEKIPMRGILDSLDPYRVASLYLDTNQVVKGEQKLKDSEAGATPALKDAIDQTLFYLAVGDGKEEPAKDWLKSHTASEDFLSDAVSLAQRYHRDAIGLELARKAYELNADEKNLNQLVDAMMAAQHFEEATKLTRKTADRGPHERELFLDAISGWISHPGFKPDYFESDITPDLIKLKLTNDEKRNLGYLLEEAGYTKLAEGYFVDLASNQSFESHDVQELLGFWSNNFTPSALAWITHRIATSSDAEQVRWVTFLNDADQSEAVADYFDNHPRRSAQITALYLDALVNLKRNDDAQKVLDTAIDQESDDERLEALAKLAEADDFPKQAEKAWKALYDLDPSNPDAERGLGLADFDKHQFAEAGPLLKQYLANNEGDYHINFAYAEILKDQKKIPEAATYYKKALALLDALDQQDQPEIAADKARLLYLTGDVEQSIKLFRDLLANDPDNKDVRADLAEILLQTNRLKEAGALLKE